MAVTMRHRKTLTRTKLGPSGSGRETGEVIVVARGLRAQANISAWDGGLQLASQAELGRRIGGKNRQALS